MRGEPTLTYTNNAIIRCDGLEKLHDKKPGYRYIFIDEAGFKGRRIGGAEVSAKHANFIVNHGEATARDVLALMAEIKEKVLQTSGIELMPEVEFLD